MQAGSIWLRSRHLGNQLHAIAPPGWLDLAALSALARSGWLDALSALARPGCLDELQND